MPSHHAIRSYGGSPPDAVSAPVLSAAAVDSSAILLSNRVDPDVPAVLHSKVVVRAQQQQAAASPTAAFNPAAELELQQVLASRSACVTASASLGSSLESPQSKVPDSCISSCDQGTSGSIRPAIAMAAQDSDEGDRAQLLTHSEKAAAQLPSCN